MDDAHGSAPTSLQLVEAAPFLSALEFEAVCDYLVEKYQDGGWADNSLALHIQASRRIVTPEPFKLHTTLRSAMPGLLPPSSTCIAAQSRPWRPPL